MENIKTEYRDAQIRYLLKIVGGGEGKKMKSEEKEPTSASGKMEYAFSSNPSTKERKKLQ